MIIKWHLNNILYWFTRSNPKSFHFFHGFFHKNGIATWHHSLFTNIHEYNALSFSCSKSSNIIDNIFKQIEKINNDNDTYFIIISLWFDNLSYFIHEYTEYIKIKKFFVVSD